MRSPTQFASQDSHPAGPSPRKCHSPCLQRAGRAVAEHCVEWGPPVLVDKTHRLCIRTQPVALRHVLRARSKRPCPTSPRDLQNEVGWPHPDMLRNDSFRNVRTRHEETSIMPRGTQVGGRRPRPRGGGRGTKGPRPWSFELAQCMLRLA